MTDWTNPVPKLLGEREDSPRTIRFPKTLAADLKQLADAAGQDFTTFTLYALLGAVDEMKARRPAPDSAPRSKRPAPRLKRAV